MSARPGKNHSDLSALARQVEAILQKLGVFADKQPVLVAVSGGMDSMVLLHVLNELAPAHGWRLALAHFNHCLRVKSSDADQALVVRTAKKLRLSVSVGRGNVRTFASRKKISIEMSARELRHRFLAQTARRRKGSIIALGHHAGDQTELFFLRLLRGTATEGLAGMRAVSSSPVDKRVRLVRPLLGIERATLENYARERGIAYRQDASNLDTAYLRNHVRHELIPALKKRSPALEQTVCRLMEIARAESELIGRLATDWLNKNQSGFETLDVALRRRCLADQLTDLGIVPEFNLIERLRNAPGQAVTTPGGKVLIRHRDSGRLDERSRAPGEFKLDQAVAALRRSGQLDFGSAQFVWRISEGVKLRPLNSLNTEYFDADTVGPRVTLRHWRPGDRYQPIGMTAPVKLQNVLTNLKVPRAVRVKLVVAEDAVGRIFWVEGCRISELHKVTNKTRRSLKWSWDSANRGNPGLHPPF